MTGAGLLPVRLALNSMVITVLLIAAVAWLFLGLPPGACILLGAILAPTDPVLASEVQVQDAGDRDKLRFALTGEGGLNDGTAFPFVMLGLGLLGLHDLGSFGWRWFAVDVVWATGAGLAVGWALGLAIGRLVLHLRREHKEAVGLDDFLALGLIALSYGCALLLQAYGFLAVFAAGVALRWLEQSQSSADSVEAADRALAHTDRSAAETLAVDPQHAPAFMAQAVLGFNEQAGRIGEVAIVITIGALLWAVQWQYATWWFVALLLLVVLRPLAVFAGPGGRGRHAQPAAADRLVRHPRHRLGVLPDVRHQSRPGAGARRPAGHPHAVGRGEFDPAPWHLGDAADGFVYEPAHAAPGRLRRFTEGRLSYMRGFGVLTAPGAGCPRSGKTMKKQAPDAIDLLDADHLAVHGLFQRYRELVRRGAPELERRVLAEEICMELTIHARLEEELLLSRGAPEAMNDDDLMDEAVSEHGSQRSNSSRRSWRCAGGGRALRREGRGVGRVRGTPRAQGARGRLQPRACLAAGPAVARPCHHGAQGEELRAVADALREDALASAMA